MVALAEYITSYLNTSFAYGVADCVLFAVGWAQIASGTPYLHGLKWRNEKEALRLVKKLGGLEAAFDKHFTRIAPNYARDGDIALAGGIAYLFSGAQICGMGKDGLIFKSRAEAECAFSCS